MYTRENMKEQVWDVIVIGGGPAGMMAAAKAGERGRSVLLLEKNRNLGKKLLITGGGRCNVTNNKPVVRDMLHHYKDGGKFLFSTFMQHGVAESIDWFKSRGVLLKEENERRLFPDTDAAITIRDALADEMKLQKVTIHNNAIVSRISYDEKHRTFSIVTNLGTYTSSSCIVATGGTSRPETGSSGDGYGWLEKLGHRTIPNNFALVPLTLKNSWTKKLSGLTLPKVKITLYANTKKQEAKLGKLLFTHVGITGPTILNMSKTVGELLEHSEVTLMIDLFPEKDAGEFKLYLRELLSAASNKKLKNVLGTIIPSALAVCLLEELKIDGETPCHSVSSKDRTTLATQLKAVPLSVKGLLGADKAVISAGGVTLEEIDFKTMESKLIPHMYVVGDMLNIDRPSGGYSLQLCWTTGFVAGDNA
jgi:predicted Rossmann fold flavoprotein